MREHLTYNDLSQVFVPLVEKCKKYGRAMRIGTNHGSLSDRIMSYYGDSPRGMVSSFSSILLNSIDFISNFTYAMQVLISQVESAFEFARICRKLDYHNFVFSMKASNPVIMVQAYRLLVAEMYVQGWDYPLHLGVTEAGEGEDGRMKSAIGIGTLLQVIYSVNLIFYQYELASEITLKQSKHHLHCLYSLAHLLHFYVMHMHFGLYLLKVVWYTGWPW